MDIFFQIFFILQSILILMTESNFWLKMYVPYILKSKTSLFIEMNSIPREFVVIWPWISLGFVVSASEQASKNVFKRVPTGRMVIRCWPAGDCRGAQRIDNTCLGRGRPASLSRLTSFEAFDRINEHTCTHKTHTEIPIVTPRRSHESWKKHTGHFTKRQETKVAIAPWCLFRSLSALSIRH